MLRNYGENSVVSCRVSGPYFVLIRERGGVMCIVVVQCDSRNRICDVVILLWFLVCNTLQTKRNVLFLHSQFQSEITSVCSYLRPFSDSQWTGPDRHV